MMTDVSHIDAMDEQILGLLGKNAPRAFGDIGRLVGLSAPAVKRRIDRLEEPGVIRGYGTLFGLLPTMPTSLIGGRERPQILPGNLDPRAGEACRLNRRN